MDLINHWSQWLPQLLVGFRLSIQVTLTSLAFGIPLGLILALCNDAKIAAVRKAVVCLVEVGRGAPVLVLLQFLYFGLPTAGLTLSSLSASIAALAFSTGAYTSEIIRSGLHSVPIGQREAAYAIGLNRIDTLRLIILPQGMRVAVPPLLGFSLLMLQASSLCFTISLPELVSRANEIGSETFMYMPVFVLVGLFYSAVCVPSTLLIGLLEKRLSRYD